MPRATRWVDVIFLLKSKLNAQKRGYNVHIGLFVATCQLACQPLRRYSVLSKATAASSRHAKAAKAVPRNPGLYRKANTHTAAEARFRFRADNSKGSIRASSGRSKIAGMTNPGAARPSKAKTNIAIGHMYVLSLVVTTFSKRA